MIISGCREKPQTNGNLVLIESFNSIDDQVYFAYHNYITDTGESLIITDNNDPKVVEVSYDGRFIRTFGNIGKGPCEFTMVTNPVYKDDKLFVYALGNAKVIVYNKSGECVKEIPIQDFIWQMTTDGNFIYAFSTRENDENLVRMYNMYGEFIKSFGNVLETEDLKLNYFEQNLNNLPKMTIYDDKVWLLHLYYPVLKIYSLHGELLNYYALNEFFDYQERLKNTDVTIGKSNSSGAIFIYRSLTVNDQGVYLEVHDDHLVVDYFNYL